MRSSGISIFLVATWFTTVLASAAVRADIEPGSLLIQYGWPSSINGKFSAPLAAAELGQYDYVVLGAGLEKVTHPDHTNTVNILADAAMAGTVVFGYIDLGVTTFNYSMTEIQTRVDEWIATGVNGIFFDDYGQPSFCRQLGYGEQGGLVQAFWVRNTPDLATVDSAFYPELSMYYEMLGEKWLREYSG